MVSSRRSLVCLSAIAVVVASSSFYGESWARGANTAAKRPDGLWEQLFFIGEIKIVYAPKEFMAGGRPAVIRIENRKPGKIEINSDRSRFADESLKEDHLAFDSSQGRFELRVPGRTPSKEVEYILSFDCKDEYQMACRPASAFFPVFNPGEPILMVGVKANPVQVSVWRPSSLVQFELRSDSAYYDVRNVRIVPDPRYRDDFSIGLLEFIDPSGAGHLTPKEVIGEIPGGAPGLTQWARLRLVGFWAAMWTYVLWDLARGPVEVPIRFAYEDQYERTWSPIETRVRIEYVLPLPLRLAYYLVVLLVFSLVGNAMRWIVGRIVPRVRSELRAWTYSWLLAAVLCTLGFVLQAKLEPLGVFELGYTSVRGMVMTGLVAGVVPDEIRHRIQALVAGTQGKAP